MECLQPCQLQRFYKDSGGWVYKYSETNVEINSTIHLKLRISSFSTHIDVAKIPRR